MPRGHEAPGFGEQQKQNPVNDDERFVDRRIRTIAFAAAAWLRTPAPAEAAEAEQRAAFPDSDRAGAYVDGQ